MNHLAQNIIFFFLQDLSWKEIYQCVLTKNATSLASYATLFFYAENLSGKELRDISGLRLLEQATQIAEETKDRKVLFYISKIWEEPFLGANKPEKAKSIRDSLYKNFDMYIVPNPSKINEGETIVFKIMTDFADEVSVDNLFIYAFYGKFDKNVYTAPILPFMDRFGITHKENVKDEIFAVHIPTWKKISISFLVQSRLENYNIQPKPPIEPTTPIEPQPYVEPKPPVDTKPYVEPKPPVDTTKNSIEISKNLVFPSNNKKPNPNKKRFDSMELLNKYPNLAQKILMKSEDAKLDATNEMITYIKKILETIQVEIPSLKISNTLRASGINTTEAYSYEDNPYELKVTASITRNWAMELIKRYLQSQDISLSDSSLKKIENSLPLNLEVEGTSSLNN
jgi:hypothetical protein